MLGPSHPDTHVRYTGDDDMRSLDCLDCLDHMMFLPKLNELGSGDYTSGGFSADKLFPFYVCLVFI